MFRAQQNAFDDVIAKATDENLTSENWEYIIDVCDRVGSEPNGPKDAVIAMIKRLAHRNANVQLYTLELANALSQNCDRKMHQELASRSFTDALLRLANDRNTHHQVKAKILERMAEWAEMFSKDPDLGIMDQAYSKLKSQNPNLHPPSKPTKRQITDVDRQKEEEELQMALALSVREKPSEELKTTNTSAPSRDHSLPNTSTGKSGEANSNPVPATGSHGTTAATVSRVRALYDFVPTERGELQFRKGDIIAVLESVYKDWWSGSLRGQTGIFPLNYVEKLADPTPDQLQREAEMEAEVFGQIKNVEKLLTLLSTSGSDASLRDNEEVTELYHATLSIRPKLVELIGTYSQRKDDFTQLNEKFIKARRDYESLLEASMVQPSSTLPPTVGQNPYDRMGRAGGAYAHSTGLNSQAIPAQHGPGRFYTPGPEHFDPQFPGPGMPIYANSQSANSNDPQPFGKIPSAAQVQYPSMPVEPHQHLNTNVSQTQQLPNDPFGHHRPQSTYDHPQELSSFNSPVAAPQTHPRPANSVYSTPQHNTVPPQGSSGPTNHYSASNYASVEPSNQVIPSQTQVPQQPLYAPPQPPGSVQGPPRTNGPAVSGIPHLQMASTASTQPPSSLQPGYIPRQATDSEADNPADFYR